MQYRYECLNVWCSFLFVAHRLECSSNKFNVWVAQHVLRGPVWCSMCTFCLVCEVRSLLSLSRFILGSGGTRILADALLAVADALLDNSFDQRDIMCDIRNVRTVCVPICLDIRVRCRTFICVEVAVCSKKVAQPLFR